MPEELYNSHDYCLLVDEYEALKLENEELIADKVHLINAAMDGGDKYHYAAHDIGYRDLERKCKALEADYAVSNIEISRLNAELARRDEYIKKLEVKIPKLNVDLAQASTVAYDSEVARTKLEAQLARRDEIIARLKEDGERLATGYEQVSREAVPYCVVCKKDAFSGYLGHIKHDDWCPITLHRALMKELEG